jgi:hypothetical protein
MGSLPLRTARGSRRRRNPPVIRILKNTVPPQEAAKNPASLASPNPDTLPPPDITANRIKPAANSTAAPRGTVPVLKLRILKSTAVPPNVIQSGILKHRKSAANAAAVTPIFTGISISSIVFLLFSITFINRFFFLFDSILLRKMPGNSGMY